MSPSPVQVSSQWALWSPRMAAGRTSAPDEGRKSSLSTPRQTGRLHHSKPGRGTRDKLVKHRPWAERSYASTGWLSTHGHKYGNVFRPAYGSKLFHPEGAGGN